MRDAHIRHEEDFTSHGAGYAGGKKKAAGGGAEQQEGGGERKEEKIFYTP